MRGSEAAASAGGPLVARAVRRCRRVYTAVSSDTSLRLERSAMDARGSPEARVRSLKLADERVGDRLSELEARATALEEAVAAAAKEQAAAKEATIAAAKGTEMREEAPATEQVVADEPPVPPARCAYKSAKCVKKSQARTGFDMASDKTSVIAVDTVIDVIETKTNDAGTLRIRFSGGWVSEHAGNGAKCFELVRNDLGAPPAAKAPERAAAAVGASRRPQELDSETSLVRTETNRTVARSNDLDLLSAKVDSIEARFQDLGCDDAPLAARKKVLLTLQVQLQQLDATFDEMGLSGLTGESPLRSRKRLLLDKCGSLQSTVETKLQEFQAEPEPEPKFDPQEVRAEPEGRTREFLRDMFGSDSDSD